MKNSKEQIIKTDWKIIAEILRSLQQCRTFNTECISTNKKLIAYNFDLLLHHNYITSSDGELSQSSAIDELDYLVDFISENANITFKGHELLDCLNSKVFSRVKDELNRLGIDGSLKTTQKITTKLLTKHLKEKLKL